MWPLCPTFHVSSASSSALLPPRLRMASLEWHEDAADYARVILAAREVALLYRAQALAHPMPDRRPPRMWMFVSEDVDLAPLLCAGGPGPAPGGGAGDPCLQTQAFARTQAPSGGAGHRVRPLGERLVELGLRAVRVNSQPPETLYMRRKKVIF